MIAASQARAGRLCLSLENAMNPEVDKQQQKVKEFMSLLPLTLAVAGLPSAEPGRFFSDSQLEARAISIRAAYKTARQIVMDIAR